MQMKGACRRARDVVAGVALFADFCTEPDQILRNVTALFCLASFSAPQRTKSLLSSALSMARVKSKNSSNNSANIGFEAKLWLAADKLRSNMDAAEYKHVVLGLTFL